MRGRLGAVATATLLSIAPAALLSTPVHAAADVSCDGPFQVVPSPNPGNGDNVLSGVLQEGAAGAWAVGYSTVVVPVAGQLPTTVTDTLIEHWDGTTWSVVNGANLAPGAPAASYVGKLNAVAGGYANVWAVGDAGLIEHWDGTSWTRVVGAAGASNLLGVWDDNGAANDVWAVGTAASGGGFTEHWDGTTWSTVAGDDGATSGWTSVSGYGSSAVWALGPAPGGGAAILEHWDGTSWTGAPLQTGDGVAQDPGTISVGAGAMLDGSTTPNNGGQQAFIQLLNGATNTWQDVPWTGDPGPAGYTLLQLTASGVSPLIANGYPSDAWFVGDVQRPVGASNPYGTLPPQTYAVRLDGDGATYVPSANASNDDEFLAVAGFGLQPWAVGFSIDPTTGNRDTLIETTCVSPPDVIAETPVTPLLAVAGAVGTVVAVGVRRVRRATAR